MRKLFESFHRFITESEEDATLGKLLQLDPEHAASFIETLADIYPDIEKRYIEAIEIKKERAEASLKQQNRMVYDLLLDISKIENDIEQVNDTQGPGAAREAYLDNKDRINQLYNEKEQANKRSYALSREVRKLKKAIEVFKPDLELDARVADAQATIDRFTKE